MADRRIAWRDDDPLDKVAMPPEIINRMVLDAHGLGKFSRERKESDPRIPWWFRLLVFLGLLVKAPTGAQRPEGASPEGS